MGSRNKRYQAHAVINPSETITIPIGEAYRVLELYTDEIATVSEWAGYMGYSNRNLVRKFKNKFNRTPKKALIEYSKNKLLEIISDVHL